MTVDVAPPARDGTEGGEGWGYGHCRTDVDDGVAERGEEGEGEERGARTKETKEASGPPTTVEVPSMGDLISRAAVAAVETGSKVAMDEGSRRLRRIKTIDVRASTSGTVTEVLVAEGETWRSDEASPRRRPTGEARACGRGGAERRDDSKATTEAKKMSTPAEPARRGAERGASVLPRAETRCLPPSSVAER